MIEGVRKQAISGGLSDEVAWDRGTQDLSRTTGAGGMFCYIFFNVTGRKK